MEKEFNVNRYKFEKYKENLEMVEYLDSLYIRSYDTFVAKVEYEEDILYVLDYFSATTSKHCNYVANQLNLRIVNLF